MPDNGAVIITGKLDDAELTKSIDKLVRTVDDKLGIAASHFEQNIGRMQLSLHSFAQNANTKVGEIKTAFQQLGTTYDQFARAMERAAAAASGMGSSGGSSGGGTKPPAVPGTIGALREEINAQKQLIDGLKQETVELQHQVDILRKKEASYKRQLTSSLDLAKSNVKFIASDALSKGDRTLAQAQNKLYRLQDAMNKLQTEARRLRVTWQDLLPQSTINRLQNAIDKTTEKVKKLQQQANMPTTMTGLKGMSEKTLEDISLKMNAIRSMQMKMPVGSRDITALNMEYARLSKMQSEILGKNTSLISSNSALGRSFNYIKNRLAFALTVGALTGFVRSLLEVRGQYELLERSLGVLMDDMERGSQIFNELNEMALKSPFTLIELGTAAKQLSAYNFAADEVVDTTRRLADISSALGVPMERLVYNLGQIKAQGVLNARDARDFANAGLAIVPLLAEMYTEQKRFGEQAVTTAQVYDMMKKKMVTYNDVLRVIYKTTDEGGKFFDFQAKQAGTLKVQLANLNLAWNNMLNDIGKQNQGMLSGGVKIIRDMLRSWRDVLNAIKAAGVALGVYKTISMIVGATHVATWGARALINIKNYISAIKSASGAMATFNAVMSSNVVLALASALAGLITYFTIFKDTVEEASQDVKTFGENGATAISKVKTLEKILQGSSESSTTHKKALEELNTMLEEYGLNSIKEGESIDVVNEKRRELIELIKEESAERERANQLMSGQQRYEESVDAERKALEEALKKAQSEPLIQGLPFTKDLKEVQENAQAISEIIASVTQEQIHLIAGKTGEEYEKGLEAIFAEIQKRMRAIGISESTIKSKWLNDGIFEQTNIVSKYINAVADAKHAQDIHNESVEKNYEYSKNAADATMTFTQKVEANSRALKNNSKDAVSLYNRIMDIVKVAEQNHIITFDLRLTAQNPPKWMFDKSLPELEQLARNFAAIAKSANDVDKININGVIFTREQVYERALQYASAAKEKQYKEEQKAQDDLNKKKDKTTKTNKNNKKSSDELAKVLQNEISLIKKLQSEYDKLTKAGVTQQEALALVQDAYSNTLGHINATMKKYKLPELDLSIIKGRDPNAVLQFFTTLRDILSSSGLSNVERMKAVDGVIEEFSVSAKTYNLDKITKGLNNELGKLKEEYELAIELDANPELSNVFADMMGISKEEIEDLPKDYAQVMRKLQSIIDQNIGSGAFNLSENLNKASFDQWVKERGNELDDGFAKALDDIREYANKVRLDETKQITQDWDKLLEKYAEYEYKRIQIIEESERELETARKHGASADIVDAIINKKKQELAKLNFDEFQKSSIWITATGDLSKLSNQALQILIDRLVEFKRENKDLDPKQIQKINKALRQMRKEQAKDNPFKAMSIAMLEADERAEEIQMQMDDLQAKIDRMQAEEQDSTIINPENQKILQEMKKELVRLGILKEEVSKIPFADKAKTIGAYVKAFKAVADSFKQIADSTNDFNLKQTADAISDVIGNFEAAEQGAQTWGGWWGAIIGGVTDAIPKIMKWVSGNAQIDYDIQQSQIQVKKLTNFYKELEAAANKAYGVEAYGAQKAMLINKEFQKTELERQLTLEKSRKKKYQDQSAIADLEGQIIDLKNEINEATENIVNDLLGITSKADFAENLVSSMIDAFKQGEDYMKVFEESFEDMVDNMIMKAIVSRLVGDWINSIWDSVNAKVAQSDRVREAEKNLKEAESKLQGFEELANESPTYTNLQLRDMWRKKYEEALTAYNNAITPTPEDIATMREFFEQGRDDFKNNFLAYMDAFGIKFGEGTGKADLSAMQQGIMGITEDTAGALEAYMNGVSQQVYLQSDLLTQIRDILINFGGDVTIATNAQILLQLQQSFQVQMTIQNVLTGVLNASGLAFRVELTN